MTARPDAGGAADTSAAPGAFFSRNATGLVREVSPLSTLVFNFVPSLTPVVLAISLFWVLGVFPGANLYLAILVAFVVAAALAVGFGLFSATIPRSGGDYILVGRTLHPGVGLVSSFCMCAASVLSAAFLSLAVATIGVGPGLTVTGLVGDSPRLVSWGTTVSTSQGWQFAIGCASLILVALVLAGGWAWILRFQNVGVAVAMGGLVLAGIVLLFKGHDSFVSSFNGFAQEQTGRPDVYNGLIKAAQTQGIDTSPAFSLGSTWPAIGAVMGFTIYSWWSIHIAGEVRRARSWRTPATMVGAAAVSSLLLVIFIVLFLHTFGSEFFTAANALNGTADYPFGAPPYFTFLAAITADNIVVAVLVELSLVVGLLVVLYIQVVQPIRALFAYSFDGILPLAVSRVSTRRHVPVAALAIVTAVCVAALAWAVWGTSFYSVLAFAVLFLLVAMLLLAVSAIILPFRLPETWRASSTASTVAGIPVVSLGGALSLVGVIFAGFLFLKYPGLGIANRGLALRDIGMVAVAGVVYYYIASWVRGRQGVRLAQVYGEIPPE